MEFKVSVIIPVYNASKFIEKAVDSALNQSYVHEIILIEDGSIDNSLYICKKLSLRYSKVKVFRHPSGENKGRSASRNLGIRKALFDYVSFLDADDFYIVNYMELARNVLRDENTDGCYGVLGTFFYNEKAQNYFKKRFYNRTQVKLKRKIEAKDLYEKLVLNNDGWFSIVTLIVKRRIAQQIKFDIKLNQAEDTDFILRLALESNLVPVSSSKPVVLRGVHEYNSIHNLPQTIYFRKILYKKWYHLMLVNKWSASVNRKHFRNYVAYEFIDNRYKNTILVLLKLLFVVKVIVKEPKTVYKLIF